MVSPCPVLLIAYCLHLLSSDSVHSYWIWLFILTKRLQSILTECLTVHSYWVNTYCLVLLIACWSPYLQSSVRPYLLSFIVHAYWLLMVYSYLVLTVHSYWVNTAQSYSLLAVYSYWIVHSYWVLAFQSYDSYWVVFILTRKWLNVSYWVLSTCFSIMLRFDRRKASAVFFLPEYVWVPAVNSYWLSILTLTVLFTECCLLFTEWYPSLVSAALSLLNCYLSGFNYCI